MQLTLLRDLLLKVAQPYSNLHHSDDTLYMERWIVRERRWRNSGHVRLHHICTEDRDAHLHDHPFDFWSLVLTGGYFEARPTSRSPCFVNPGYSLELRPEATESVDVTFRSAGSLCFRRACDRHKIVQVLPDTWTLVFASPLRQWWGFYTPVGKIHWRDYEKKHNARFERYA